MSASTFETAHRLVVAAEECLRTAHQLIESNVDDAHPSLVSLGSAVDAAELAGHRLDFEIVVPPTKRVTPLRPADDDPFPPGYRPPDSCLESWIKVSGQCYFEWLAETGRCCAAVDTKYALETLACESMLAAS